MLSPKEIVDKMMKNDAMSIGMGFEIISISLGKVNLKMTVKASMLNGFGIAHGGVSYALSDSCIAFSANTHGKHAVSVETSISHLAAIRENDVLTTSIQEVSLSKRFGIYIVSVYNQNNTLVANLKGTMYRKDVEWED